MTFDDFSIQNFEKFEHSISRHTLDIKDFRPSSILRRPPRQPTIPILLWQSLQSTTSQFDIKEQAMS